jgi:mannose/fructose-specific phosphotransferase system component IIA
VAAGLVSAVQAVCGRGDTFVALSNAGLSGDALLRALRELVEAHEADAVFTDLPAGSPAVAARRLQRDKPSLSVVAGTNVAMLLEYALRDDASPAEAADKGRAAVVAWPGTPASAAGA